MRICEKTLLGYRWAIKRWPKAAKKKRIIKKWKKRYGCGLDFRLFTSDKHTKILFGISEDEHENWKSAKIPHNIFTKKSK